MGGCTQISDMVEALSWFGAAFQPVMLEILIKLMELRTSDYDPPCNTIVQHENHPKCISNAVKIYVDRKNTQWNNLSHGLNLNITEAGWAHQDRKQNKKQPTSKEEL